MERVIKQVGTICQLKEGELLRVKLRSVGMRSSTGEGKKPSREEPEQSPNIKEVGRGSRRKP